MPFFQVIASLDVGKPLENIQIGPERVSERFKHLAIDYAG
jgi:hypothetical protein